MDNEKKYSTDLPDGVYLAQVTAVEEAATTWGIGMRWVFTILEDPHKDKLVFGSVDPKPANPRKFVRWLKPFNLTPSDVWSSEHIQNHITDTSMIGEKCVIMLDNGYVREIMKENK